MISPHDDLVEFVLRTATPEEILAFKPSPEAVSRAEELLERNSDGELTPDEADELEQIVQLDLLVSVIKARALVALKQA